MLIIDDFYLLNALLEVLWTVKFDVNPQETGAIGGSPFVAEIYNRTYEEMILMARKNLREDIAQELERNRSIEKRSFELEAVYSHIKHSKSSWKNWTTEQKKQYVQILFSPYKTTDDFLNSVVEKGDFLNEEN